MFVVLYNSNRLRKPSCRHVSAIQTQSLTIVITKNWDIRRSKPGYERYDQALTAALNVIGEYYEKTEDSDAYVLAMGTSSLLFFFQ